MNGLGILFTVITTVLLLRLPRQWCPLPLLMAASFITIEQQLEVGPLHFPAIRILIVVGVIRVVLKREKIAGGVNNLDRLVIAWGVVLICGSAFHKSTFLALRFGEVYNGLGIYFLFRVFVQEMDDVRLLCRIVCIVLIPLAASMFVEKWTGKNPLGPIGFGPEIPELRNGYFRAQGPFGHSILAGTVGAVSLPMAIYLWRTERTLGLAGLIATGGIVYASGSSGPIMTAFSGLAAVGLWKLRGYLKAIRWLMVALIVALDLVMNDPVYFLMARIDIAGGSTGYFRAALIRSAIAHIDEWWLTGTDRTRHWMPSGITANVDHTDMTNYYLQMGVWGGLPLMILFSAVLVAGFVGIGKCLKLEAGSSRDDKFLYWTLGSILFAHGTTFWSVGYFDQTVMFLYFLLGTIGSVCGLQSVHFSVTEDDATWVSAGSQPTQGGVS